MSRAERLRALGPAGVAESRRAAADAAPPTPDIVEEIRQIFAPAIQRLALAEAPAQRISAAA